MEAAGTLVRLALDHNFPTPILSVLGQWVKEATLVPIRSIDERLEDLPDHRLVASLAARGWTGLVTCDHHMLDLPRVLAAVHQTRFKVVAIEQAGDDPLVATGALLLELPRIVKKMGPSDAQVFRLRPRAPTPVKPWDLLGALASRKRKSIEELFEAARLSEAELKDPMGR